MAQLAQLTQMAQMAHMTHMAQMAQLAQTTDPKQWTTFVILLLIIIYLLSFYYKTVDWFFIHYRFTVDWFWFWWRQLWGFYTEVKPFFGVYIKDRPKSLEKQVMLTLMKLNFISLDLNSRQVYTLHVCCQNYSHQDFHCFNKRRDKAESMHDISDNKKKLIRE